MRSVIEERGVAGGVRELPTDLGSGKLAQSGSRSGTASFSSTRPFSVR